MVAVGHPTVNLTLPSLYGSVVRDFDAYSHLAREGGPWSLNPQFSFSSGFKFVSLMVPMGRRPAWSGKYSSWLTLSWIDNRSLNHPDVRLLLIATAYVLRDGHLVRMVRGLEPLSLPKPKTDVSRERDDEDAYFLFSLFSLLSGRSHPTLL